MYNSIRARFVQLQGRTRLPVEHSAGKPRRSSAALPCWTFLLSSIVCLAGCQTRVAQVPPLEQLFPSEGAPEIAGFTSTQRVSVSLDGTLSMQGFARPTDGKYSQFLQDLDLSLSRVWQRDNIRYHRFGSIVEDVTQHPFYVAASETNFYQATKNYATTRIDTVLRHTAPGTVNAVITDLFEQDLDIASIEEAVKSAGFPEKAAIGVWQWELPFNGSIYDFDLKTGRGQTYSGPRPLYMIALGPEPSLLKWNDALRQTLNAGSPNFLLISRNLTQNPRSWLTVTRTESVALIARREQPGAIPYALYRVAAGCTNAELSARAQLSPIPNSVIPVFNAHPNAFRSELFSVSQISGKWTTERVGESAVLDARAPGSQATSQNPASDFRIAVPCSALAHSNLLVLSVRREGTPEDIVFPSWITLASVSSMQFNEGFQRHVPAWGNKTINLIPLLRGLANDAVDGARIARSYLFLSKG